MGGVQGCTHLTEMLSFLPTAAVQTFAGLVREDEGDGKPFQLDHCHALETTTDTVREYYPKWYRGNGSVEAPEMSFFRSKAPQGIPAAQARQA